MRKGTLYTLSILCVVFMMSCKKDKVAVIQQPETSDQLLTKVVRTTSLTNDVSYDEVINYQFNEAGKIIVEGKKTYVRDEQQRISRIFNSIICEGRPDTKVYYSDANPDEVSFTLCALDVIGATDSTVYLHEKGRLTKTMSYVHYLATASTPEHTSLEKYNIYKYDDEGNLSKANFFSINAATGATVHCGQFYFKDYYKTANPLYASDEVRTAETGYEGLINSSKNNFYSIGDYTKNYEYRADGRPRSAEVKYKGTVVFKLTFVYN